MSQSKLKKVKLNFIFGIVGQIVTLGIGLIIPRLFIVSFGSEVNGFINSMNQVFMYVALLEAGVGSASLQALYDPVDKQNQEKINGIISATNFFYNKTGLLYLLVVAVLAFVYPLLVSAELPYFLMVAIVGIAGFSGALPYFFQAKYKILLQAEGKGYISSAIATLQSIVLSGGKVVLLLLGSDVIAVQSVYLIVNLLISLFFIIYIKKNYPWIDLHVKPDLDAISQKNAVLVHQMSTLVFNNTDILILTFFCDLKTVSIYVLYKNFIGMISTLLSNFLSSPGFVLGQAFSDRERFIRLNDVYETFHVSITFALCTIAYLFITPFMTLYTAGMDTNYLIPYFPLLMILAEILNYGRMPSLNISSYAGHFKQTQWRSVLESAINLVFSFALVNLWGINGVVVGTILALLYRTNDMIIYSNKTILNRSPWQTYKIWLVNIVFSIGVSVLFYMIPVRLDNYFVIVLGAIIMCIVVVPLQILVGYIVNPKVAKEALEMAKNAIVR